MFVMSKRASASATCSLGFCTENKIEKREREKKKNQNISFLFLPRFPGNQTVGSRKTKKIKFKGEKSN